jgi:hypothetical protein
MQQDGSYQQRVARARQLLGTVRHAAIATINADGSPHNSPVFSTWDADLNFYWASGSATQHSQNITRDPRVFVVLYDSMQQGGGLYMQGRAAELGGTWLEEALEIININRQRWGRQPVVTGDYIGNSPQRLYKATRITTWVNVTERDASGDIVREHRQEVAPHDLLQ